MTDEYFPNNTDAQRIKRFKRANVPNERIAEIIRVDLATLEKHYPFELEFTDEEDLAVIADVAYEMAKSGEDPGMTKWWLTVKGGWVYQEGGNIPQDHQPLLVVLADDYAEENDTIEGEAERIDNDDSAVL